MLIKQPLFSAELGVREFFDDLDVDLPAVTEYLTQKGAQSEAIGDWSLKLQYENTGQPDKADPTARGLTTLDSRSISLFGAGVMADARAKYINDRIGPAAIDDPAPDFSTYVEQSLNRTARHELVRCADLQDPDLLNAMIDYDNETELYLFDARRFADKYDLSRWLGAKACIADIILATHVPAPVLVGSIAWIGLTIATGKTYKQHLEQLLEVVHAERHANAPHEQRAMAAETEQATFFTVTCSEKWQAEVDDHLASL